MKSAYLAPHEECVVTGWAYTTDLNKLLGTPTYLVNQIFVAPAHRSKGMATAMLTEMTKDADAEGVTLILDFQPSEFSSDVTRLQVLYERFGFTWDEAIGGMKRLPNG